jgi:hypothetical protein
MVSSPWQLLFLSNEGLQIIKDCFHIYEQFRAKWFVVLTFQNSSAHQLLFPQLLTSPRGQLLFYCFYSCHAGISLCFSKQLQSAGKAVKSSTEQPLSRVKSNPAKQLFFVSTLMKTFAASCCYQSCEELHHPTVVSTAKKCFNAQLLFQQLWTSTRGQMTCWLACSAALFRPSESWNRQSASDKIAGQENPASDLISNRAL